MPAVLEKTAPEMGQITKSEWKEFTDPETGRKGTQLTSARGNSYPLYYFIPSISADGRYLVFHSERSGWVQLYRLDLNSGDIIQLTDGRSSSAGWAFWCEWRLRGIRNHLSALNVARNEVYYFQDDQVRRTHLHSLENSLVTHMPAGRLSIGQSAFSPDGKYFAFIHAGEKQFERASNEREALSHMGLWKGMVGDVSWRDAIGDCVVGLVDTESGAYREVLREDYHFHHVLFLDDQTLLLNHPRNCGGMWTVDLDGRNYRHLRSHQAPGAHNAQICHQVITQNGIHYEANGTWDGARRTHIGRYDVGTDTFEEVLLPKGVGYVHTGRDPAGRFLFIEKHGGTKSLCSVHHPRSSEGPSLKVLRKLSLNDRGQRHHAHPFLSPCRTWMYFTDRTSEGFNQIFRLNVEDLVDLNEYW